MSKIRSKERGTKRYFERRINQCLKAQKENVTLLGDFDGDVLFVVSMDNGTIFRSAILYIVIHPYRIKIIRAGGFKKWCIDTPILKLENDLIVFNMYGFNEFTFSHRYLV